MRHRRRRFARERRKIARWITARMVPSVADLLVLPSIMFRGGGVWVRETRSYWSIRPENVRVVTTKRGRVVAVVGIPTEHPAEHHIVIRPAGLVTVPDKPGSWKTMQQFDVKVGREPHHR